MGKKKPAETEAVPADTRRDLDAAFEPEMRNGGASGVAANATGLQTSSRPDYHDVLRIFTLPEDGLNCSGVTSYRGLSDTFVHDDPRLL
jgi:hypothetical protein